MHNEIAWFLYRRKAKALIKELLIALDRYEVTAQDTPGLNHHYQSSTALGSRKWLMVQQRAGDIVYWSCHSQNRLNAIGRLLGGPNNRSDYRLKQIAWLSTVGVKPYDRWEIVGVSDGLRMQPEPEFDTADMWYHAEVVGGRPNDDLPF